MMLTVKGIRQALLSIMWLPNAIKSLKEHGLIRTYWIIFDEFATGRASCKEGRGEMLLDQ